MLVNMEEQQSPDPYQTQAYLMSLIPVATQNNQLMITMVLMTTDGRRVAALPLDCSSIIADACQGRLFNITLDDADSLEVRTIDAGQPAVALRSEVRRVINMLHDPARIVEAQAALHALITPATHIQAPAVALPSLP
jgi:hypothetical protein